MKSENLKLTDRSYKYAVDIVKFINLIPKNITSPSILNQLLRAATSISANIYEGQGASSRKDFINFYQIAYKSAVETKFWLNLIKDTSSVDKIKIELFITETQNLTNILIASLKTLKSR